MIGFIFIIATIILQVNSGLITHSDDGNHKATSYQSFNMEHFHAVPTHVKKDYKHLLEHPIPVGKSSTNIKVQHGDKHDYGYAIVDLQNTLNAKEEPTHEDENVKYVYYAQPSVNYNKEEEQSSYAQQSVSDKEDQSSYTNYEEPKSEKLVAQVEEDTSQNDAYQVYQHAQTLHHYALAQSAQAEDHQEPAAPVALALHGVNYGQGDSQLGHDYYQSAPQKQYEHYQNQDQSQSEHNS